MDYQKLLFQSAIVDRRPLTTTIEIIGNCNFRCIHCYISDCERKNILSLSDVVSFCEQIRKRGGLYVTLTGGEVFLHPQFVDIYAYLIRTGFSVSIFTNASMLTDDILQLFSKYPPRRIEITLYGFSRNTYIKVTGAANFEIVKSNILKLIEHKHNILLKMFLLKENCHDFDKIVNFAKENNIPFKFDGIIVAKEGSPELNHQLDINTYLELIQKVPVYHNDYDYDWTTFVGNLNNGKLFQCGAGRSSCWLKANNRLRMCNFLSDIEVDMTSNRFDDAWEQFGQIVDTEIAKDSPCYSCVYAKSCNFCPAKSNVHFGNIQTKHCLDQYLLIAKHLWEEERTLG